MHEDVRLCRQSKTVADFLEKSKTYEDARLFRHPVHPHLLEHGIALTSCLMHESVRDLLCDGTKYANLIERVRCG